MIGKLCACGWRKPLVGVTCRPAFFGDIIVFVECPMCSKVEVAGEVTAEVEAKRPDIQAEYASAAKAIVRGRS